MSAGGSVVIPVTADDKATVTLEATARVLAEVGREYERMAKASVTASVTSEQFRGVLASLGATSAQAESAMREFMNVPSENRAAFVQPFKEAADAAKHAGDEAAHAGEKAKSAWEGLGESLMKGLTFGGGFAVGEKIGEMLLEAPKKAAEAMVELVKESAEEARQIQNMATALGTTTHLMEVYSLAAKEAGIQVSMITQAATMMERKIVQGSVGFERLGLTAHHLKEMLPGEALDVIMTRLSEMPNHFEMVAAAGELFGGRVARTMLPFIEQMRIAKQHAEDLGVALEEDEHEALVRVNTAIVDLSAAYKALASHVAAAIAQNPELVDGLHLVANQIGNIAKGVPILAHAIRENWSYIMTLKNLLWGPSDSANALGALSTLTSYFEKNPKLKDSVGREAPELDLPTVEEQMKLGEKDLMNEIAAARREAAQEEEQLWREKNREIIADLNDRVREAKRLYEEETASALQEVEKRLAAMKRIEAFWQQQAREQETWARRIAQQGLDEIARTFRAEEIKHERRMRQLAELGRAFAVLGDTIGGGLGSALIAVGALFESFARKAVTTLEKVTAAAYAAATAVSIYQNSSEGRGGVGMGVASGAAAGAAFGPYGAIIGGFLGGIIALHGQDEFNRKAMEAGNVLGRQVTDDYVQGLIQSAKREGIGFSAYLKKVHEQEVLEAAIKHDQETRQGVAQAQAAMDAIYKALPDLADTPALHEAIKVIGQKVADAMAKSGLGYMTDPRLFMDDKGQLTDAGKVYSAAQTVGTAGGQLLSGMRQAGMVDTSLTAAMGSLAGDIQQQAYNAAIAAGLDPTEATKAGFGAITPILTQQLNNSLATGQALDAKTQELIDQARANGIEIVADPLLVANDLARKQLDELIKLNQSLPTVRPGEHSVPGQPVPTGPPGTIPGPRPPGYPADLPWPPVSAAGGYMGSHALETDTMFLAHKGEHVFIAPKEMAFVSAARGYGEDWEPPHRYREPDDGGGGGSGVPGGGGPLEFPPSSTGSGSPTQQAADQVMQSLGPILRAIADKPNVAVAFTVAPNINENPLASRETRQELRDFTVAGIEEAVRLNQGTLVSTIQTALLPGA